MTMQWTTSRPPPLCQQSNCRRYFSGCLYLALLLFVEILQVTDCNSFSARKKWQQERTNRSNSSNVTDEDYYYAVVVDAGSSGSRIRVYRWLEPTGVVSGMPEFTESFNLRLDDAAADYADNKEKLEEHVTKLIDPAKDKVPKSLYSDTPIYFMATAGMRMLQESNAYEAIEQVKIILKTGTINPFLFESSENARILSGEEEGVFAWIAVNYLSDVFKKGEKANRTYGILELGGASTQIAFLPRGSILADKFPVTIGGVVYPLYVHSYLRYGQKYVDMWIKEELCKKIKCTNGSRIENPCMLKGDEDMDMVDDVVTFVGTGQPELCVEMLNMLVYKAQEPWHCFPKPCAIGASYQPTIQNHQQFYLLGAFFYPLKSFGIVEAGVMSPKNTTDAAYEFCRKHIDEHTAGLSMIGRQGKMKYLSTECLIGLYMPILFVKGYGFELHSRQILAKNKIKGTSIEWPLGAVIYEYERSACRHCPKEPKLDCNLSALPSVSRSSAKVQSIIALNILTLTLLNFINYSWLVTH